MLLVIRTASRLLVRKYESKIACLKWSKYMSLYVAMVTWSLSSPKHQLLQHWKGWLNAANVQFALFDGFQRTKNFWLISRSNVIGPVNSERSLENSVFYKSTDVNSLYHLVSILCFWLCSLAHARFAYYFTVLLNLTLTKLKIKVHFDIIVMSCEFPKRMISRELCLYPMIGGKSVLETG